MSAEDHRPGGGASLPSSGDLAALSERIGDVHADLNRSRALTRALGVILVAVAIGLGTWNFVQQSALNARTAEIARLEHRTAQLASQNAARDIAAERRARALCIQLNKTRAEIFTAWQEVQFRPGADRSVLLARVRAAEPLSACPKAPAAGH